MQKSLFTCNYCGKNTSEVDYDYLSNYDHLSCALEAEKAAKQEEQNPFDLYEDCIMCGKKTTVSKTTHIDFRDGYIEGAGQLCIKCWNKGTDRRHLAVPMSTIYDTPNDAELGSKIRQLYWENQ
jgi:hypothetical protein